MSAASPYLLPAAASSAAFGRAEGNPSPRSRCSEVAKLIGSIAAAIIIAVVTFVFLPWELATGATVLAALGLSLLFCGDCRSRSVSFFPSNSAPIYRSSVPVYYSPPPVLIDRRRQVTVLDSRPREAFGDGHLNFQRARAVPSSVGRPLVAPPSQAARHVVGRGHESSFIEDAAPYVRPLQEQSRAPEPPRGFERPPLLRSSPFRQVVPPPSQASRHSVGGGHGRAVAAPPSSGAREPVGRRPPTS